MKITLRAPVPPGVQIVIDVSRPLPIDWNRWRDARLGAPPLAPIREEFTAPEGWAVTIVEVSGAMHAFYAVLDRAVHARATGMTPETRAAVRAVLATAVPIWDAAIVALADL